jgi:hypothetical protein
MTHGKDSRCSNLNNVLNHRRLQPESLLDVVDSEDIATVYFFHNYRVRGAFI